MNMTEERNTKDVLAVSVTGDTLWVVHSWVLVEVLVVVLVETLVAVLVRVSVVSW